MPAKKSVTKKKKAPAKKARAPKEPVNDSAGVDAYMKKLKHPLKAEMEAVRSIILKANSKMGERVKWNAPSFFHRVDMAAFNPRAQDFVQVIFVFPPGTMIDDATLLEGDFKDRRMAKFHSMADIEAKRPALERFVNQWVALAS